MMKSSLFIGTVLFFILIFSLFTVCSGQEGFTVKGTVTDEETGNPIAGVNVILDGLVSGTITDRHGNYSLNVRQSPPQTIYFSFVGHETVNRTVTDDMIENNRIVNLDIALPSSVFIGQEVIISASRYEEKVFESPVTVEKMDILSIQESAPDTYYKALGSLKGIDLNHSSINFQVLNARGFSSTSNVRIVQLIDGMDTQAPALNFPIGNLNGPSMLDVESVEFIPGASSALYGPNAFNGLILINSKDPFLYPGVSAFVKTGINHINHEYQPVTPLYHGGIRYAKAFKDKIALKVNASYMKAEDWWGRNFDDNVPERQGDLSFNPGSDLVHKHGDEAGVNLAIFSLAPNWPAHATSYGSFDPGNNLTALDYANAGDLPSTTVTLTPWEEQHLVDYDAENLKINSSLHYRITDKIEALYAFNWGYGTSVYTGAQRYSLVNFKIGQHKLELKSDNFLVRGYTTLENSGDSYIAEFLALKINEQWISEKWGQDNANAGHWLGGYAVDYLRYLYNQQLDPGELTGLSDEELINLTGKDRITIQEEAHMYARQRADIGRYVPGTPQFEQARQTALDETLPKGATFADKSNMIQFDAYYDFKNEIPLFDLQAGIMYRQFNLRSNGTIFDDRGGLSVNEYGGFVQAGKKFLEDKMRFQGSVRYDKNENFKGLISPRISAIYKWYDNQALRFSFQTGFRNPTTQNQHIDLDIVSRRLLGGLPQYARKYQVDQNSYTLSSVQAYTEAILDAGATQEALLDNNLRDILVESEPYDPVGPENIRSLEMGYKGLIWDKIYLDAVAYYNTYDNFIGAYRVRKANGDIDNTDPAFRLLSRASLLNGNSDNTFDMATNFNEKIAAYGTALGINYSLPQGYLLGGNWNWNRLNEQMQQENPDFRFAFNTPEHKFNLQLSNRRITERIGFNINFRWQSAFLWESTFAIGQVQEVSTIDAQISFRMPDLNSVIKLGADNMLNNQYVMNYGGPEMGAIYYISLTFDEFLY